jgi:hypothetical protein
MDFFERIFHISLDGGNGFAEFLFILGSLALGISAAFSKAWRQSGRTERAGEFSSRRPG